MSVLAYISLLLMASLYIFAGISHFTKESFFLKIVPPYLPKPKLIVQVSGIAEIILGVLLFVPMLRSYAAWGVIILLIVVFPANIYMLQARLQKQRFKSIPVWTLWLRLVIQFALMYWAYLFT